MLLYICAFVCLYNIYYISSYLYYVVFQSTFPMIKSLSKMEGSGSIATFFHLASLSYHQRSAWHLQSTRCSLISLSMILIRYTRSLHAIVRAAKGKFQQLLHWIELIALDVSHHRFKTPWPSYVLCSLIQYELLKFSFSCPDNSVQWSLPKLPGH